MISMMRLESVIVVVLQIQTVVRSQLTVRTGYIEVKGSGATFDCNISSQTINPSFLRQWRAPINQSDLVLVINAGTSVIDGYNESEANVTNGFISMTTPTLEWTIENLQFGCSYGFSVNFNVNATRNILATRGNDTLIEDGDKCELQWKNVLPIPSVVTVTGINDGTETDVSKEVVTSFTNNSDTGRTHNFVATIQHTALKDKPDTIRFHLIAGPFTVIKDCDLKGYNLIVTIVLIVILDLLMLLTHMISTITGLVKPVKLGKVAALIISPALGVTMIVTGILIALFGDKAVVGGQGIAPISTAVSVAVYAVTILILSIFLTPKVEGWQKVLLIVIAVIIFPFGLGLGIGLLIFGRPEENNKSVGNGKPNRPGFTSCCQTSKVSCMGGNTTEPSRGQGDGKENSPKFTDKRRTTESNATTTGVQLEEKKPTESNVTTIGVQREENKTENKSTTRPQPEPPKQAYENYPEKELDQHTYQNNFRPQPLPPNQDPHYLETLDMSQKNRSNEPHPLEKKGVTNENEEKSKKKKKKKKKNQTADTPRNDNDPAKDKNEVDSKPDNENKDN